MNTFAVLALVAFALTAVALFQGIASMAHGGPEDDRASHGLMFKRCAWQGAAFLLLLLAMLTQFNA
jgi:hypothetical protein